MKSAINDPEVDLVVIGLPNNLHLEAVKLAAAAGRLCFAPNRSAGMPLKLENARGG